MTRRVRLTPHNVCMCLLRDPVIPTYRHSVFCTVIAMIQSLCSRDLCRLISHADVQRFYERLLVTFVVGRMFVRNAASGSKSSFVSAGRLIILCSCCKGACMILNFVLFIFIIHIMEIELGNFAKNTLVKSVFENSKIEYLCDTKFWSSL